MARNVGPGLSKTPREKATLGSRNDGASSAITEARTPRGFGIRLCPTSSRAYGRPFPRDRWKCRPGRGACAPTFFFKSILFLAR